MLNPRSSLTLAEDDVCFYLARARDKEIVVVDSERISVNSDGSELRPRAKQGGSNVRPQATIEPQRTQQPLNIDHDHVLGESRGGQNSHHPRSYKAGRPRATTVTVQNYSISEPGHGSRASAQPSHPPRDSPHEARGTDTDEDDAESDSSAMSAGHADITSPVSMVDDLSGVR